MSPVDPAGGPAHLRSGIRGGRLPSRPAGTGGPERPTARARKNLVASVHRLDLEPEVRGRRSIPPGDRRSWASSPFMQQAGALASSTAPLEPVPQARRRRQRSWPRSHASKCVLCRGTGTAALRGTKHFGGFALLVKNRRTGRPGSRGAPPAGWAWRSARYRRRRRGRPGAQPDVMGHAEKRGSMPRPAGARQEIRPQPAVQCPKRFVQDRETGTGIDQCSTERIL